MKAVLALEGVTAVPPRLFVKKYSLVRIANRLSAGTVSSSNETAHWRRDYLLSVSSHGLQTAGRKPGQQRVPVRVYRTARLCTVIFVDGMLKALAYCWSPNSDLVDSDWLANQLSSPIRCAPATDLVLLFAYMCPYSLEINISSSFFLHFWKGNDRKCQNLALAACSVPRKADQATTNSEFWWIRDHGANAGFLLASIPSHCRLDQ